MPIVKVKKPKAVIFDLSGTAAKSYFTEKILFGYIRSNLNEYIEEQWTRPEFVEDLNRLREYVQKDREEDKNIPEIPPKGTEKTKAQQAVHDCVMYYVDNDKENPGLQMFKFSVWFNAFKNEKIRTPVYSDVVMQLKRWKLDGRIKVYVFSNGWTQAQKLFLAHTNHGDISHLIDGHFDTEFGELTDKDSYKRVLKEIREDPKDAIFLTKSPAEARACLNAGIKPILVITHERAMKKLDKKDQEDFLRIRSFYELEFE